MTAVTSTGWDAEFRPRLMRRAAVCTAVLIATAGIVVAVFNNRSAGATLRVVDQVSMAGLALVLAGALLVLTRPRVRIGPPGLLVRNVLEDRLIAWEDVVDVSFPRGKRWARIDLAANEYLPVVAIQSIDGEHALAAMDAVRRSMARYRSHPDPSGRA